ncbi:MAG: flagellar motor protein MotD [Burkholderiaceae bacterium]|jgi:chemotaxis protein MotB|nr:flagellar motor protein MotD [Burkholderiaceae bacterium]
MARKRREEEHENHERWLVSYADFITLLFAFFVVMYAVSSVNEGKYRVLSNAINAAFRSNAKSFSVQNHPTPLAVPLVVRPRARNKTASQHEMRREREKMKEIGREMREILAPLIRQGKVRVIQTSRGVNVEISASVLFASGDARLSKQSETVLAAVAQTLRNEPNDIQIEGFTDSNPISSAQYPSNWELSSARASSVVRLMEAHGIRAGRMVVIGRGENDPIADNDTADGRAQNRRVGLTVLSRLPEATTEIPVTSRDGQQPAGNRGKPGSSP